MRISSRTTTSAQGGSARPPTRRPPGGAYTFIYIVTRPGPVDFRAFLERHAELLRALRAWTIRLLVPRHFARVLGVYRAAFREQLAMPLRPVNLDDLRWYFHARQAPSRSSEERFDQAARAFRAPRFRALYRAWLDRGEPVLDAGTACERKGLRRSRTRARHTAGGVLCRPNRRGCLCSRGVSDPPGGRPSASQPRPGGSLTPRLRVLFV